jgi:hypothetical protein
VSSRRLHEASLRSRRLAFRNDTVPGFISNMVAAGNSFPGLTAQNASSDISQCATHRMCDRISNQSETMDEDASEHKQTTRSEPTILWKAVAMILSRSRAASMVRDGGMVRRKYAGLYRAKSK